MRQQNGERGIPVCARTYEPDQSCATSSGDTEEASGEEASPYDQSGIAERPFKRKYTSGISSYSLDIAPKTFNKWILGYAMFQKRRKYDLQKKAPHTRQMTARKNGPSPPPNKAQATKSTSPPTRAKASLTPVQKSSSNRPNILRNTESKVFANKSKLEDSQTSTSVSTSAKSIQSIDSKTVHIQGLPSSLTIERIENDSIVCITCRNPGK